MDDRQTPFKKGYVTTWNKPRGKAVEEAVKRTNRLPENMVLFNSPH